MSSDIHITPQFPESGIVDITDEKGAFKIHLDRLDHLYSDMDERYRKVAAQYEFYCRGCEDNCCRTTFYHHTVVEYLYLKAGFLNLDMKTRTAVLKRAQTVNAQPAAGLYCPVCQDDRCLLYDCRPMICRLHGIAHELRRPDGCVNQGPGCAEFEAVADGKPYIPFDRTDFYWKLSRLERDVRADLEFTEKLKMTVSQMVIDFMHDCRV